MQKSPKKLYNILIVFFLSTLPFFVGKVIYTVTAFQFGQYLIPLQGRITLATLLAFGIVAFSLYNKENNRITAGIIIALVTTNLFAIIFSKQPLLTQTLLISTSALIGWFVTVMALRISISELVTDPKLYRAFEQVLFYALCLEGVFVLTQWLLKGPLAPEHLQWTGQPIVFTSPSLWGITEFPRVYGTTPHPNIFATVLLFLLALLHFIPHKKTVFTYLNTVLLMLFIVATLSKMAFIALIFLGLLTFSTRFLPVFTPKKVVWGIILFSLLLTTGAYLLTPHIAGASFLETRTRIIDAYLEILSNSTPINLLTGHGFRTTLTILLSTYSTITTNLLYHGRILIEVPHTLSLLIPFEFGIIGTVLLLWFIYQQITLLAKIPKTSELLVALSIIVSVVSAFDHLLLY